MATWQFVADMASASPTVNLDLNNGSPFWVGDGYDLSPPPFDKSRSGGALRPGQVVTRSVAQNRTLTIPVQLVAASASAAATPIENLMKMLSVDNILKVQFGSTPVFFRTFADPGQALEIKKTLVQYSKLTLEIEAEPFAYGPRVEVTGSPFTVSNNPAATNPCLFDVTGVLGDAETPLLLAATSTAASGTPSGFAAKWTHFATRRRGTPSGYSNVIQAESMTTNNGAAVVADASFSGGSKIRVTPGPIGMTARLNAAFPSTSSVEARGEYRVYARVAKTVAGDTWDIQLRYGVDSVAPVLNDVQRLPTGLAGAYYVDMGFLPVPAWSDPIYHGYSRVAMKAQVPWVAFYAQRVAGSGALDVDFLYFMPADESTLLVKWPDETNVYVVDGTTDAGGSVYSSTAALDEVVTTASPSQIAAGGGFPEVIPGQTNRIHLLRNVDPNGTVDAIGNTTTIRAYYWPRWLEPFRP